MLRPTNFKNETNLMRLNPSFKKLHMDWQQLLRNEREIFIKFNILWNIVIALGCIYLARLISVQDDFSNLGNSVRFYVTLFALIPVVLAITSSILLYVKHGLGRYLSLLLQFVGLLLTFVGLLHVWGTFLGFETTVDHIMRNANFLIGLPIAYGIYWISTQFNDDSPLRAYLVKITFAVGLWSVLLLITWNPEIINGFETAQDKFIAVFIAVLGLITFWLYIKTNKSYLVNLLGMIVIVAGLLHTGMVSALHTIAQSFNEPTPWILTLGILIFGVVGLRMLYMGVYFGETQDENIAWQGWLLLSPNVFGFCLFFAGPLLLSFYLSFSNSTAGAIPDDIGFENYQNILALETQWLDQRDYNATMLLQLTKESTPALDQLSVVKQLDQTAMSFGYRPLGAVKVSDNVRLILGAKDYRFWISLRNTLMFCLLLVPMSTIPAIGLALILNSNLPGVKIFRAMYFLPSVAAVVGTALIWRWLYDPTIGFFNYFIKEIIAFINSILGMQIAAPTIEWLTGPGVVLFSVVFLAAWQVVGFNTVLFLAGLQGIPKTLYEAAQIDGANRRQQLFNVTLPMLKPTTFFVITTTIITGLQVFNEPYALFPSRPIPENATTAVFYLYNSGFQDFEFGYASAVAWILFFIIFGITLIQFRLTRSEAYE